MTDTLQQRVVQALADKVLSTVQRRGQGHCLQVAHVPIETADDACRIVAEELQDPDKAIVVSGQPDSSRPWQATPSRVVELRNGVENDGGRLALFLPSGQHLAAEDSFGRSTFEVLDIDDLYAQVIDDLRSNLRDAQPAVADLADTVIGTVRGERKFGVGERDTAAYLARLIEKPTESEAGRALVEFGLLPDSQVAHESDEGRPIRLARNLHHIEALTELGPPADRIEAIGIDPELPDARSLKGTLVEALRDGTVDRHQLSSRLDAADAPDFAPVVGTPGGAAFINELSIVGLSGPFVTDSQPLTLRKADASVRVRYRCRPTADTVDGLQQLRLELLQLGEQDELVDTGVEATKGRKALPHNAEASWSVRVPTQNLDSGQYRLRLRAVDADNYPVKEAFSEIFRVHEDVEEIEEHALPVVSVEAACVAVMVDGGKLASVRRPQLAEIKDDGLQGDTLRFAVRFDGHSGRWRMETSALLARVQSYAFLSPRSLARYRVSLTSNELEETILPDDSIVFPQAFLDARERVLAEIARNQRPVEGRKPDSPLVELADLVAVAQLVDEYASAWADALEQADSEAVLRVLLSVDQVTVSDGPLSDGILIGPLHPLRLAWLTRYSSTLREWLESNAAEAELSEVAALLDILAPANVPHVVVTELGELRHLEPLDLYWGVWAPPAARDVGALAGILRTRLKLPRTSVGGINVSDLVQRIRRYLAAHPYVELLEMNFVQPGAAELVLDALLTLQADESTKQLRYVVRLFSTTLSRSELGRRLDEFMADPDATKTKRRNEADAFLSSTDDPLTPKLTYSKHEVGDLLAAPERYPAHLSFFLDWFDLDVVPVPPTDDRRSFYADGLIVDPIVVYREGSETLNPQWDEHVATATTDTTGFGSAYAAAERATARLLGTEAAGTVPAVRLELDRASRSVLDAVHRHSDWVVVIDPVFTDDYLDSPPQPGESPRYLIDTVDPGALETDRRIVISTRSRVELRNLLTPVLTRYELEIPDERVEVLLDALRTLSPGLPLKLLNNPTHAIEALSLSLASIFLANGGILRHALVIPLDVHQELFHEGGEDENIDLRRTDLAIVRIDPEERQVAVSLVEVKARGRMPAATPPDLIEHIDAQLENSRTVLRNRLFSAEVRERSGSLAGALMVRRLTRLLARYAERALRYGLLEPHVATTVRSFITTLDDRFSVSFEKHALIFDLEGESLPPEQIAQLHIRRIGRADILDLLAHTQTPVGTRLPEGAPDELATVFAGGGLAQVEEVPASGRNAPSSVGEEVETDADADAVEPGRQEDHEPDPVEEPEADSGEGPRAEDVLLVGSTETSNGFGIVGRVHASGQNVAFDVEGTNVVAVFGVQGSGKSYTVGNLIEAALVKEPALNRLPHPLGVVVFHYARNETYIPEFAAMAEPNDDSVAIEILASEYGVDPRAVDDVRILVPEALYGRRRSEFPGVDVHPLMLATGELQLPDWKLLMGVEGGDQLYVKAMTTILRGLRGDITLPRLRAAIDESTLSQASKTIAETRLQFVEEFAADLGGAAEHLAAGRLLIVDVRDPLLDEGDVLALFMVLLRLFSQALDPGGRQFNKLIVFDEAHKYMDNPRLTKAITETVREMRHIGTSVIISSQNPPSVPRDVIELCSILIAHKFTSPQWLEHIKKVNEAFGRDLAPPQLAALASGEAYVWSREGAVDLRRPQRVKMRPRLSKHGGGTRRAGDE